MRSFRSALLLLATLLGPGCGLLPGEAGDRDDVEVEVVPEGIRVTSHRDGPVAFTVWNRQFLGLFAPCLEFTPACLRLQPEVPFLVPPEEVVGGRSEDLVVYWWTVVPGPDGPRLGELHQVPVPAHQSTHRGLSGQALLVHRQNRLQEDVGAVGDILRSGEFPR